MNQTANDPVPRPIRLALVAILVLGLVGTGVELLLLKHTEGFWQLSPLVLMAAALLGVIPAVVAPSSATIRVFQVLMAIFVVSGAIGVLQHYRGNAEWELERMASLSGFDLFRHAIMGATPTLAPGTMIQLGLVGLLFTYRHPALRRSITNHSTGTVT